MEDRINTLDQIPDNPLDMPPPFWQGGSAIFHFLDSLNELVILLSKLVPIHNRTELRLDKYHIQHPDDPINYDELTVSEIGEICKELWELEHRIKLKAEIAMFMCTIQAEDDINCFCVFNLHKDIAKSIETLPITEKLRSASATLGVPNTRSISVYVAAMKLFNWRNSFAYGHCVDRPTKSLYYNHLISRTQYPSIPDTLDKMRELIEFYIRIKEFLRSISLNRYTALETPEDQKILEYLKEILTYHFKISTESNDRYNVEYYKT